MDKTLFAKVREEINACERNVWIKNYIKRRENPIVIFIYFVLLALASFVYLKKLFADGKGYPFWICTVAVIVMPIVLAVFHKIFSSVFKGGAEKNCPFQVPCLDDSRFAEAAEIIAEKKRLKKMAFKYSGSIGLSIFLSPVIVVLCYQYFIRVLKLTPPEYAVTDVVIMCVFFAIWGFLIVVSNTQDTLLPVSDDVSKALETIEKEEEEKAKAKAEKEERIRLEYEEEQKRLAEEAQSQARFDKAESIYKEAVSKTPYDYFLMRDAAILGHVDATLTLSAELFDKMSSDTYTQKEKMAFAKETLRITEACANDGNREIQFLSYVAHIYAGDVTIEACEAALRDIRKMVEGKEIPEKYDAACNMMLGELVARIDENDRRVNDRYYSSSVNTGTSYTSGLSDIDHDDLDAIQNDLVNAGIIDPPDYSDM